MLLAGCTPAWMIGQAQGRSPLTPAVDLERLAESDEVLVRAAVAGNPRTPEPTLLKLVLAEKLAPAGSHLVWYALGANPASSERVLLQILGRIGASPAHGEYVKGVLENPSLTPKVLDALARDQAFRTHADRRVAAHPLTSPATLEYIVRERPNHFSGSFALIAANPNANAATLQMVASHAKGYDAARVVDALLARDDLPFEALRRLAWASYTPWMRQRLYAHAGFEAQRVTFETMTQPEARRVLFERHGTPDVVLERLRRDSAGLTLQASILRHAAALRAMAARIEAEHPGLEIDFFQSIHHRANYVPQRGSKCVGFEGFQEWLRVSVRRVAPAPPRELGILAEPLPGLTYCLPPTSTNPGPLYVGVSVDRFEKELRAVLLRDAPTSPFVSYLASAYTAERDSFFSWEDLRDRFGWQGSAIAPKIEILDGPGRGGGEGAGWIVVGRILVDNLIVDGSIRHGTGGMLLRRGTRILRRPSGQGKNARRRANGGRLPRGEGPQMARRHPQATMSELDRLEAAIAQLKAQGGAPGEGRAAIGRLARPSGRWATRRRLACREPRPRGAR